jgi:hypothetical protein
MQTTKHAQIRMRQRGIPEGMLSVVMDYGIPEKAPGDATRYQLNKRGIDQRIHELKNEIQRMEKLKNVRVIIANNSEYIITVCREV